MIEVLDALLDPLSSGLGRRALAEVALLGALGGGLSFWVTSYRLSYAAESLAHGLLPGAVAAALIGVPVAAGAGAGVLLAALLVVAAARDERIGVEAATAVAVSGLVGLGALLALAPDSPQRLEELLFGDPLSVTDADLAVAGAAGVAAGAALVALHRPLTAVAFDPGGARAAGVKPALVSTALLALVAMSLAVAVRGLGNLLALAVLVAPAVAVRGHVRTPAGAVIGGAVVAVVAGLAGVAFSFALGVATGASVALALCAAAVTGGSLAGLRPERSRARRAAPSG
ncbi:MAG: metal ABC transporter permease [Actinomycetota bacterium]|nr:metal ABC transporter permease [Actinomycetota bacterium]